MNRGYTKDWRKGIDSDVWLMPPLYDRVWRWLRLSANHKAVTIPTQKGNITLQAGQKMTSYRQIAEGVAWSEWGVLRVPSAKTIKVIIEWLQAYEMVTVESNSKGTVITIVNWHTYQNNEEQKVTAESNTVETRWKHGLPTNKNEKNEKKKEGRTENQFRQCIEDHMHQLKTIFPFADIPLQTELIVAKFGNKTQGPDVWPLVLGWFNKLPKPEIVQTEKTISISTEAMQRTREAMYAQT